MRFAKMQGTGNDYIFLDCTKTTPENLPALAVRLSQRHFGIGSDGLICVCPSQSADFRMKMFNADGSQGEMCGNGIRCLAKFVRDQGLTHRDRLRVETLAGIKEVTFTDVEGQVSVDMGPPRWGNGLTLRLGQQEWKVRPVSMGNPHAVIFVEDPASLDLSVLGPGIEHHPAFPHGTNVEFVKVLSRERLSLRVWERGSGETLSCGTGACAALTAAVLAGRTQRKVSVELPGGTLLVSWQGGRIRLTGPAVTVFEGEIPL